jgi:hypothetical protein
VRKRNSNDLGNTGHFSLSMSEHHFTNWSMHFINSSDRLWWWLERMLS